MTSLGVKVSDCLIIRIIVIVDFRLLLGVVFVCIVFCPLLT